MSRRRQVSLAALLCAGLALTGCGGTTTDGTSPTPSATTSTTTGAAPDGQADAGALLEEALAARASEDPQRFASLVAQAAATCVDPAASRRLGEASAIAGRWADALAFARPKVQARTEAQLAEVDWEGLVDACATP